MANGNPFTNMRTRIQNWIKSPANHYISEPIPKDHTDVDYDDSALAAYRGYFRLWLSEMFLTTQRAWFTTWYPAAHSSVQLKFGDREAVDFSHVTRTPQEAVANSVQLNERLTDLLPFNGGSVEIEAELLAIKGHDYFDGAVSVLQDFSGLITAPLGQVLDVVEKVSKGIDTLIGKADTETHLAFRQSYVSAGGGGNNDLKPGYVAVILATRDQVDVDQLWVRGDRLYYGKKGTKEQLSDYDYMLFRIEGRKERDDYRLKNIEEQINKAIDAMAAGDEEGARSYKMVALATAAKSPDLAVYDRRRVAQAIKDELADISANGLGAVGGESRDLEAIVTARAMTMEVAAGKGEMSFDELLD